jgi:hypothetical protein
MKQLSKMHLFHELLGQTVNPRIYFTLVVFSVSSINKMEHLGRDASFKPQFPNDIATTKVQRGSQ